MSLSELLALALSLGVHLSLDESGEKVQLTPKARATPELRAGIRENKPELLLHLSGQRGPPADAARSPKPRLAPPNTTPTPDVFFDEIAPTLGEGELRVLLYLIRRTYGFKRGSDRVSLTQFCSGIVTGEGKRLDAGTGLGRRHVVAALSSLEERGLVQIVRGRTGRGGASLYVLHLANGGDR